MKRKTPLDVLVSLVGWHTEAMYKIIELTEPPNRGGSLQRNFWVWASKEGFKGKVGGTLDYPQSHGGFLHPEDEAPFEAWLTEKLNQLKTTWDSSLS